jgi:hypothetical protein
MKDASLQIQIDLVEILLRVSYYDETLQVYISVEKVG